MIAVTRLNGSSFAVNPDLIERVQENPDTTLVMVGGATYVVRESLPEVIALIAEFRALVIATAHAYAPGELRRFPGQPLGDQTDECPEGDSVPDSGTLPSPIPLRPPEREGAH